MLLWYTWMDMDMDRDEDTDGIMVRGSFTSGISLETCESRRDLYEYGRVLFCQCTMTPDP